MGNKEDSKLQFDLGMLLAIVGVLAVPLVYVLQANGVVEIGWRVSLSLYIVIFLGFFWAYTHWKKPANWGSALGIAVGCSIALGIAGLSYLGVSEQYKKDHASVQDIEGSIISWGYPNDFRVMKNPRVIIGTPRAEVVVNGSLLSRFADDYKIITVITKNNGTKDILDRTLGKSAPYNIREGEIPTTVLWNKEYIDDLSDGWMGTGYTLLVCPNQISPDGFSTMRQAFDLGCRKLKGVSGPP